MKAKHSSKECWLIQHSWSFTIWKLAFCGEGDLGWTLSSECWENCVAHVPLHHWWHHHCWTSWETCGWIESWNPCCGSLAFINLGDICYAMLHHIQDAELRLQPPFAVQFLTCRRLCKLPPLGGRKVSIETRDSTCLLGVMFCNHSLPLKIVTIWIHLAHMDTVSWKLPHFL